MNGEAEEKIKNPKLIKADNIFNKIKYPLEFILSLLFVYLLFTTLYQGNWPLEQTMILSLVSISLIAVIIYCLYKSKKKIEKIFLAIVIPIGMLYLAFMIPSFVPDELAHLWKSYEVSEGIIISSKEEKTQVPKDLVYHFLGYVNNYREMINVIEAPTDYNDKEEVNNTAKTYPATLYIFSAIGMLVSHIMNLNIILGAYLAQLMNFIVFLIASYFTIKIIPFGKIPMMVLLLTPMMLHQATSTSSDAMINVSVLLFIAFSMYLLFKKEQITMKEKIGFFALGIFVALAKYVYLPVIGLGLLLIGTKNMAKKSKIILLTSTITVSAILAIGWYLFTSTYPSSYEEFLASVNANTSEQINYLLQNPVAGIKMMAKTVYLNGETYIYEAIGSKLGWANIFVNQGLITVFLFTLLASCFLENNKFSLKPLQRIFTLLIVAAITVLIILGLYLTWTPVGQPFASGIQGRYFIPLIPLILISLCMKENYVKIKNIEYILPILLACLNIPVIITIYNTFM